MGFTSNSHMQILPPHLAAGHQQPPTAPWNNHHHRGGSHGGRGRGGGGGRGGGSQGVGRGNIGGPHQGNQGPCRGGSQGSRRGGKRGGALTEKNLGCSMNEYFKHANPNNQYQAWASKPQNGYNSNPHDKQANKHHNNKPPYHNNKNSFHGGQHGIPTGPKAQTQSDPSQSNPNSESSGLKHAKRKFSASELPPAKVQRLEAYVALHQPVDLERDVYMCECSEAWSQACSICHENLKREFLRAKNLNEQLSFHRTLLIALCRRDVVVRQSLDALIDDVEAETGILSSDDSEMSEVD